MKKVFYFFLLIFISNINSHEFNPAHLIINEINDEHVYESLWMYPVKNIGKRAVVIYPENCSYESEDLYIQGKYIIEPGNLKCIDSLKGSSLQILNLSVLTDALVTLNFIENTFEGIVNVQNSSIAIPLEPNYYPKSYFLLGLNHLFDGFDHILFIFGLLFCISGVVNIIKTITAFTIAHSITLGLSIFDIVSLPQGTVEALISLTIVFLALEINKKDFNIRTPWIMAFGFGLLHGMGFAGALSEIGIANNQMILSLLFFNIGIEIAQLLLIPLPLLLIYISKKFNFLNIFKVILSFFIGSLGFYWFIDRVLGIIQ
tara:strand:- start:1850 stop:2797 length:948 start_codon:yes stop_codon:yes gene_type:complete